MSPLLLVVVSVAAGLPPALTRPLAPKAERWAWPARERFEATWAALPSPAPALVVVKGRLTGVPEGEARGWFLLDDRLVVRLLPLALEGNSRWHRSASWSVVSAEGRAWKVGERGRFDVDERLGLPLAQEELLGWTYASTLMNASGPLYQEANERQAGSDQVGSRAVCARGGATEFDVDAVVAQLGGDPGKVRAWAQREAGNDALYEAFFRRNPRGRCGMTGTPSLLVARAYAALAFERGDLGRFLHLEARHLGAPCPTAADEPACERDPSDTAQRLISTGVDLDRFLLGLLVARPAEVPRQTPWRLARAIRELGRGATLSPRLWSRARDGKADPFNRLLALQTWAYLEAMGSSAGGDTLLPEPVLDRAAAGAPGPLGQAWVEQERARASSEISTTNPGPGPGGLRRR